MYTILTYYIDDIMMRVHKINNIACTLMQAMHHTIKNYLKRVHVRSCVQGRATNILSKSYRV